MVEHTPLRIAVIGVAGSGKSTVGRALAERLGAEFIEGDDFHPPANVAKMAGGIPLDDGDRWDWLALLRQQLTRSDRAVLACSALRRAYRDVLRSAGPVRFVFLDTAPLQAAERLARRSGHFMRAQMVDSQFAALERPMADETDVVTVDASSSIGDVLDAAIAGLSEPR